MTFYTNIYINLPYEVIKHIVGKKGSNFVRMSQKCKLNYIWYNKDTNTITLYGAQDVLEKAKKYVCKVIEGYVEKFATEFLGNIYNTNTMDESCTEVSLDGHFFTRDDVKHLIGSEGSNLKDITRKSNAYFIWYNSESHAIQIWGTKYHTLNAIKMLQQKIDKVRDIINKHESKEQEPRMKKQKIT